MSDEDRAMPASMDTAAVEGSVAEVPPKPRRPKPKPKKGGGLKRAARAAKATKNGRATTLPGKAVAAKPVKPKPPTTFQQAYKAAVLLKQSADPTRLSILLMLSKGERYVTSICEEIGHVQPRISQPAVSHHLALLRHGGIITTRRAGKNNFYSLTEVGEKLAKVVEVLVEA